MREGESMSGDIWLEIQARRDGLLARGEVATKEQRAAFGKRYTPPAAIDYRMGG